MMTIFAFLLSFCWPFILWFKQRVGEKEGDRGREIRVNRHYIYLAGYSCLYGVEVGQVNVICRALYQIAWRQFQASK
jgi:hypothetical protein